MTADDRPARPRLRVEVVLGDITEQEVDAIVNAANSSLLGGSGVDGAIHRRGGPEILRACRALRAGSHPQGLPTGQAVATTAGRLPARWVIHTVGPVHSDTEDRSELLLSCYRQSLRVADESGAASIAFPLVSAGAYRWPVRGAVELALRALRAPRPSGGSVRLARLVLWQPETLAVAREVLAAAGAAPAGDGEVLTVHSEPTDGTA